MLCPDDLAWPKPKRLPDSQMPGCPDMCECLDMSVQIAGITSYYQLPVLPVLPVLLGYVWVRYYGLHLIAHSIIGYPV